MTNVIIFSHCGLIQFALQKMVDETLKKNNIPQDVGDVIHCSIFTDLMVLLRLEKEVVCLFDIDGVSQQERRVVFELINKRFGSAALMVLHAPGITRLFFGHQAQKPKNIVTKFSSVHELAHRLSLLLVSRQHAALSSLNADSPPVAYSTNNDLTDRQQEVLNFIMLGMNNRMISTHMGISDKTVSSHRKGIYKKYYVKNIVELYHKIHQTG
jgi:DNA-binding NarL/FixJ family response regulator